MRQYEKMTKAEVVNAQRAWAKAVVDQDVEALLGLYDFGSPDEPLLFKPTLTDEIRLDEAGTRSYFVGGDPDYPNDSGFLNNAWKRVEFQSAAGPLLKGLVLEQEFDRGDVIDAGVAEDVVVGFAGLDSAAGPADDDAELGLEDHPALVAARTKDGFARPDNAGNRLHEVQRRGRYRLTLGLGALVEIVPQRENRVRLVRREQLDLGKIRTIPVG